MATMKRRVAMLNDPRTNGVKAPPPVAILPPGATPPPVAPKPPAPRYPQRTKINQQTLGQILKYFGRFKGTGSKAQQRQHMIDAYLRRNARQQLKLNMDDPRDIKRALRLHLLHQQPQRFGQNGEYGGPPGIPQLGGPEAVDPNAPDMQPGGIKQPPPIGMVNDPTLPGGPDQGRPQIGMPNSPFHPMGNQPGPQFLPGGVNPERVPPTPEHAASLAQLLSLTGARSGRRKSRRMV